MMFLLFCAGMWFLGAVFGAVAMAVVLLKCSKNVRLWR